MARAFDLRQLRYFVAVAESGSFRAAAERLHVSQPPLSRQVADLERVLGTRLLERHASGVSLTPAGSEALAKALDLLAAAEDLAGAFGKSSRGAGAPIRIGVTAALDVKSRIVVARAWQRALPRERLEVETGFSRDLIPALEHGQVDFALVGLPGPAAGLQTREVHISRLVAALPSGHRLARRKRVSLLEVTDLPFFWIPRAHNAPYYDFCQQYFKRIGFQPRRITVEPGLIQTLERIALGEGWGTPNGASLATRVKGVAYRELVEGGELAVRVAAAWAGGDEGGRYERLAGVAAKLLGGKGWREEHLLGG